MPPLLKIIWVGVLDTTASATIGNFSRVTVYNTALSDQQIIKKL